MRPIDLYEKLPDLINNDINILIGHNYNHIPEIQCDYFTDQMLQINNKVLIKIYKDFAFDSRRCWRLASVWYDDKPVMIIQNAGREGDDHSRRFVTNKIRYEEMIRYIQSLIPVVSNDILDVIDENQDVDNLDYFYGYALDSTFKRF